VIRAVVALAVVALAVLWGCNQAIDYPSPALVGFGLHNAPKYVATDLMPSRGLRLLIAHPRLGQPAIRRAGEPFDVGWIAPGQAAVAAEALLDEAPLALADPSCDEDGICHATAVAPAAPGLHSLCIVNGDDRACSVSALAVVDSYHAPARIADVSDAHVGDGDSLGEWSHVVDTINAQAPDLVFFTGDGADTGLPDQLDGFYRELERLLAPAFVVTGNHDMDNGGLDHFLLVVGPELDFVARYGGLKLVGLSDGQDLDDGHHVGTLSEGGGPDASQREWLASALDGDDPTVIGFHHPLYNGLFGTAGPDTRQAMLDLVTRDSMRIVMVGHVHLTEVYDRDGESRGLSTSADDVPPERWPLHYTCSRATIHGDGFALHTVGDDQVSYRWVSLGR
jgi:Calcineurin-like phosphoesterase